MFRSFLSPAAAMFFCGFCPSEEWWWGRNWGRKEWWAKQGSAPAPASSGNPVVVPPRPPWNPMPGSNPKPKPRPPTQPPLGQPSQPAKQPKQTSKAPKAPKPPPKLPPTPKHPPSKKRKAEVLEVPEEDDDEGGNLAKIYIYSAGLARAGDRFHVKLGPSSSIIFILRYCKHEKDFWLEACESHLSKEEV